MRRITALSRPRLTRVVHQERLLAAACLVLSLIVALPIPVWNMVPAACLLLMALGKLQRDGLLAGAGLLGAAGMLLAAGVLADRLREWICIWAYLAHRSTAELLRRHSHGHGALTFTGSPASTFGPPTDRSRSRPVGHFR